MSGVIQKTANKIWNSSSCKYCKKPIPFYKNQHKECNQKYINDKAKIKAIILSAYHFNKTDDVKEKVDNIHYASSVGEVEKNNIILSAWEEAVFYALDDKILTDEEENTLGEILDIFDFDYTSNKLESIKGYRRYREALALKSVMQGEIPELKINGDLPFNFQNNEKLISIINYVQYYESKTRIKYVGGSSGVNIKIAKGVYYKTSSFKGHRVESEEIVFIDNGSIAITTKHIYFGGNQKNFRIKLEKIVSFTPYEDGIGIQKDGITAKPQLFKVEDGWFIYNLLRNISNLH
ncbi:MAG: hypothetical protein FWE18_00245 [Alphaproteobacteria bacterium]|nr:hypothetical protein [Alphaproteobacteria bacterium]